MLAKVLSFSLSQRLFVLGATFVLAVAGLVSASRLPIDAFPEIAPTQVKIIMKAPGMTPEEVEARIVRPLEVELLGIPKQTVMRAKAKYAIADITIDFAEGTDIYWARQQVNERLSSVLPNLPDTVEGGLAPISTALSELFMFTIEGGALDLEERRSLLDWVIRPALRTLPGVADVNALGGRVRTFNVAPDEAAMAGASVTIEDLRRAIDANNRNDGAGRLADGEEMLVVRSLGAASTVEDLERAVVRRVDAGVVRIGDVATVSIDSLTRYGAVTKDGQGEAVEGIVVALKGADARMVVAGVKERLKELETSFPEGVKVDVFYDRSDLIERAVGSVVASLLLAAVLVIGLLIIFLNNARAALVVTLILPLSALMTFLLMRVLGMSANLMSLGGLAIAIGMIVDSAIVVTENTVERLAENGTSERRHTVYRAASEVALPTAAGTLIICLVFVPLLTLQGLEGKLFAPVALTIILALVAAIILALTFIPVVASFILRPGKVKEAALMRWLAPRYEGLLLRAMRAPLVVFVVAGVSVGAAVVSYLAVGKAFMPTMNEGAVVMQAASLPSINLQQSRDDDLRIERALIDRVPEVQHVISRVGSDELGLDPMSLNESDMFLELAPRKQWRGPDTAWLVGEMRAVVDEFRGIETSFTQPIEMRVSEMLTGSRGDVAIKIFGPDADVLASLAGEIESAVAKIDGATDVFTTSNDVSEYLQIDIDREQAGRFGFDVVSVQNELRARIEGLQVGEIIEPGRRTPIVIRADRADGHRAYDFADVLLASPEGGMVRLSDMARVRRAEGLASVEREDGSRFAVVQAFVSGRDLVGFVEEAKAVSDTAIELPPGYRLNWGGEFENQQRAAAQLSVMVPLSLLLIFIVLFATLRSLREALLILCNIPFALVGGIIALALAGQYLSVPASVGFIALLGIAVLNGLVLVTHFNDLMTRGVCPDEAIVQGAVRRLRPVLMTATTAAFGLMPLLFASGPGSEIQKPLAIVVIGGLISSTTLTLFLLPLLYRRFAVTNEGRSSATEAVWLRPYAS